MDKERKKQLIKMLELRKCLVKEQRNLIIERTRLNKKMRDVNKELNGLDNILINGD